MSFRISAAIVFLLLAQQAYAWQTSLGELGDLSKLVVAGAERVHPDQIRHSLRVNPDLLLANHPHASALEFFNLLHEKATAGYRNSGFPHARVDVAVRLQDGRPALHVRVDEGPLFKKGKIRVVDPGAVPVDQLVERLSKPAPPDSARAQFRNGPDGRSITWVDEDESPVNMDPPIWQPGEPARLSSWSEQLLGKNIKRALADLGFPFARFKIELQTDRAAHTVDLIVRIQDAGSRSIIQEVRFIGNSRDSDEALLKLFNLPDGAVWSRRLQTELQHRVWQSGRFASCELKFDDPRFRAGRGVLVAELLESSGAPPLSDPFSDVEQTLLKSREWLQHLRDRGEDIVLEVSPDKTDLRIVFSPDHGVLMIGQGKEDSLIGRFGLEISNRAVAIYDLDGERKLVATNLPFQFRLYSVIEPTTDGKVRYFFNGNWKTRSDDEPPLDFNFRVAPASCIHLANRESITWEKEDNILRCFSKKDQRELDIRIDSRSGQVLQVKSRGEGPVDGKSALRITFAQGEFNRMRRQLDQETRSHKDYFEPKRPVSSVAAFFMEIATARDLFKELATKEGFTEPEAERAFALFRSTFGRAVLTPLDEWVVKPDRPQRLGFAIPPNEQWDFEGMGQIEAGAWALATHSDYIFPYGSWPWMLLRGFSLATAGKNGQLGPTLGRIYTEEEYGPLCQFVVSSLLVKKKNASQAFAKRALERLYDDAFRRDIQPLLDPTKLSGRTLIHLVDSVRRLPPEDAALLGSTLR